MRFGPVNVRYRYAKIGGRVHLIVTEVQSRRAGRFRERPHVLQYRGAIHDDARIEQIIRVEYSLHFLVQPVKLRTIE